MLCRNCGTDEVRTLSAVFEPETAPAGAGAAGAAAADDRAHDRYPSATEVRGAPPVFRNVDKSISCIAVFGVIGIAWHILWAAAAIFLAVAIRDAWWNTTVWPRLYVAWQESYLCQRCGFIGRATVSPPEDRSS